MVRLFLRESVLVALTALMVRYLFPRLLGTPDSPAYLPVGAMFALTIMSLYAMTVLGGSRLAPRQKGWVGAVALPLLAFPGSEWAAALPGFLLPALGALRGPATGKSRSDAAGEALYAFAVPMLSVRWLLVPLVGQNEDLAASGLYAGVLYLLMRGLVRLVWPLSSEGNREGAPLIHRPVPDWVVGAAARAARRPAFPFALRADGSRDESGISFRCSPDEASGLQLRIQSAIAGSPFQVERGPDVGTEAQVMIHRFEKS